jgi:ribosomal protein S3AE|tara:strand:+ start:113 stop:304 length:192 start_codon:yes stop_codon:yes gene_type:complete
MADYQIRVSVKASFLVCLAASELPLDDDRTMRQIVFEHIRQQIADSDAEDVIDEWTPESIGPM